MNWGDLGRGVNKAVFIRWVVEYQSKGYYLADRIKTIDVSLSDLYSWVSYRSLTILNSAVNFLDTLCKRNWLFKMRAAIFAMFCLISDFVWLGFFFFCRFFLWGLVVVYLLASWIHGSETTGYVNLENNFTNLGQESSILYFTELYYNCQFSLFN